MSVNKLERLLNLTAVLLDTPRALTAEQIRQRVDGYPPPGTAFHRTFERDKDDLRVMGIPLRVERVRATDPPVDGYRIDADDYYLPDPGLEPEELAALHLASMSVRLEGQTDQEALWKLGGLGRTQDSDATSVEFGPTAMVANIPADPTLEPLFAAITAQKVVSFDYRSASGEVSRRVVEPWRLDFQRGRWYFSGLDHDRNDERNFRLDRIVDGVKQTGEAVTSGPRPGGDGPRRPWELGDDDPVTARLLVDASHAENAARQLGNDSIVEKRADGSVVFSVEVVRFDAFRSFVLGFLDHAELLEPSHWRAELIEWLETARVGDPA